MSKESFIVFLESALLSYDGMPESKIYLHLGESFPQHKELIIRGLKLTSTFKKWEEAKVSKV